MSVFLHEVEEILAQHTFLIDVFCVFYACGGLLNWFLDDGVGAAFDACGVDAFVFDVFRSPHNDP